MNFRDFAVLFSSVFLFVPHSQGGGIVNPDGGVDYHIELASFSLAANWDWKIGVWHDIARDGREHNVSIWRMRGVQTFVDVADSSIYWFSPDGRMKVLGRTPVLKGSPAWYISREAPGEIALSDGIGRSLVYEAGNLSEAHVDGAVVARFRSKNGRLISITTSRGDLIVLKYSLGRVTSISRGETDILLHWDDDDLDLITENGTTLLNAKYSDRLLNEIQEPHGAKLQLSWISNSAYDPRFSRWMPTALLVGDGSLKYSYSVGVFGIRICTTDPNGHLFISEYNPAKGN